MKKQRPRRQVAALPYRIDPAGKLEILLVTSRDTGRWVLPKGWPMKGRRMRQAAQIEAFEEAGVVGKTGKSALGTYTYDKDGEIACRVSVFPLPVQALECEWPERHQRQREWHSPTDASECVDESDLKALLLSARDVLGLPSDVKET